MSRSVAARRPAAAAWRAASERGPDVVHVDVSQRGRAVVGRDVDVGLAALRRVVVFIPARDEAVSIATTIQSLRRQSLKPDEIVVVCDNCSDATPQIAEWSGAQVFLTVDNDARKAGALNQMLRYWLPSMAQNDLVLLVDADSQLSPRWIETAVEFIESRRADAVCGAFHGVGGSGLVGHLQRNEYERYAGQVRKRKQVPVLSGTGTMFQVRHLLRMADARGSRLPGFRGDIYNPVSITEDNEITLAAKHLGLRCMVPIGCETVTEVMPTWGHLFQQRLRWQRGALSDLRAYGVTRVTRRYWLRQISIYSQFLIAMAVWAVLGLGELVHPGLNVAWSLGILGVYLAERLLTIPRSVPRIGVRGYLVTLAVIPEIVFDLFRMRVFTRALVDEVRGREARWHHLMTTRKTGRAV
jgi:cellulose synthase/poly-beta-1,6-N-acetylglucosamine synthase-like glycosyltransferase